MWATRRRTVYAFNPLMWRHADVYNAIITGTLPTLRRRMTQGQISWHIIWLWHDGYIGFDLAGNPVRASRAAVMHPNHVIGLTEPTRPAA